MLRGEKHTVKSKTHLSQTTKRAWAKSTTRRAAARQRMSRNMTRYWVNWRKEHGRPPK